PSMQPVPPVKPRRLPWAGLLALAGGGFITLLTETLPAGPSMQPVPPVKPRRLPWAGLLALAGGGFITLLT
ncbi:hypothetical protein C7E17_26950, partial [Stenotrophomonas maltophilia]